MNKEVSIGYERLLSCEIKPSMQRMAVMDYLLTHYTHPNVDEIYQSLSLSMPTLSKTTVYNTLKLFVDQNAALMITIDEKRICFDGDTSDHAHFLCKKCQKVYDLPINSLLKKTEAYQASGHEITETHFYYKGICQMCLKDKNEQ